MNLKTVSLVLLICLGLAASRAGAQNAAGPEAAKKAEAITPAMPVAEYEQQLRDPANRAQGVLWPGESTTYRGVTMTWKVSDSNKASSSPLGYLMLKGPGAALPPVRLGGGQEYRQNVNMEDSRSFLAYLDNAVVSCEIKSQIRNGYVSFPEGIKFQCYPQPAHFAANAAPFSLSPYLSNTNPLRVGSLTISLSGQPVKYPDGTQHYQLRMQDADLGTSVAIPAEEKSERQIGRYKVVVGRMNANTLTAGLLVRAEADPRPLGADSYANLMVDQGESYEKLLGRLAEQYKFTVEWVAFPASHPESIEFAKKELPPNIIPRNGILKDVLEATADPSGEVGSFHTLALEWTDPTHLRVWAKNYDKVVAQNELKAKTDADRAAELKKMKELFANNYTAEIKIYKLGNLSPVTAKALIEPELSVYFLIRMNPLNVEDPIKNSVLEEGKYLSILGANLSKTDRVATLRKTFSGSEILDSSQDSVTADERTNSLILRASLRTQKKVAEILAAMDNMMTAPKTAAGLEQYRIEVILLAGAKEAPGKAMFDPESPVIRTGAKDYVFNNAAYSNNRLTVTYQEKDARTSVPQAIHLPVDLKGKRVEVERVWPAEMVTQNNTASSRLTIDYRIASNESGEGLKSAKEYGISPEDLKVMGFDTVRELGRGMVSLAGRKDELGKATLTLGDSYRCQLEFQDLQKPYLIVRGSLLGDMADKADKGDKADKPLLSNTLFLEKDKPALLGLTNLKEALILLVKQTK